MSAAAVKTAPGTSSMVKAGAPAFAGFASPKHASARPAKPTPNFFRAAWRVTDWATLLVSSSNLLFIKFLLVQVIFANCGSQECPCLSSSRDDSKLKLAASGGEGEANLRAGVVARVAWRQRRRAVLVLALARTITAATNRGITPIRNSGDAESVAADLASTA